MHTKHTYLTPLAASLFALYANVAYAAYPA
ncbi:hypothetical protein SAMN04487785_109171 [Dyella jiangningensis]|nr:hypothetical protein BDW41_108169 [Dyella sp. AtDHG13]SDK65232.1 hypothetical protein SAMN04487785_109171 [Dyella jiangningensis]